MRAASSLASLPTGLTHLNLGRLSLEHVGGATLVLDGLPVLRELAVDGARNLLREPGACDLRGGLLASLRKLRVPGQAMLRGVWATQLTALTQLELLSNNRGDYARLDGRAAVKAALAQYAAAGAAAAGAGA